jgi:hypothetical protein
MGEKLTQDVPPKINNLLAMAKVKNPISTSVLFVISS